MKLVFAQGNPGERFVQTRHNVGFLAIDAFAAQHNASWQEKSKFSAHIAEVTTSEEKVLLVKPTTFYNETGQSARSIVDYYDLVVADDVLVIHDELAMPFGTIRTRQQGSDAGNNGIKSLNTALGEVYARIRIGIWNELLERAGSTEFVIGKWTKDEASHLEKINEVTTKLIDNFITGSFESVTVKTIEE